jgi:hypothetical protein
MPTTLPAVLVFVVLLLPGFAYQVGKERRGTERTTSVLRETAAVVVVSVISEFFVLIVTAWVWSRYIDFGRLIREPRKYWLGEPETLGWWGVSLLITASVATYLVTMLRGAEIPGWGHWIANKLKFQIRRRRPAFALARWVWRQVTYTHPSTLSAWGVVFQGTKRFEVTLDIRLTDGAYLRGRLMSHSTVGADTPDRELVLGPPIRYRAPKSKNSHAYPAGAVIISARNIATMFVTKGPKN